MRFLIDGYNLMHAAGVLGHGKKPTKATRRRLLDWLADGARGHSDTLRVLFDAQTAPADTGEASHRGVQVRFAFRATADDAIEAELTTTPRGGAVVVSDDTRLHEAARRRGCEAWGCARFVDWLIEPVRGAPAVTHAVEKPPDPRADDELLKAFSVPKRR